MEKIQLSRKQKIFFIDNFGSLLNAGIPIIKALQILYFQSKDKKIRALSRYVKTEIESGESIAKVASKLPKTFSGFDTAMFEMGDATGKIGAVLEIIGTKEEKYLELQRKIRQALIYPIAIITIACAMVTVILTYVIPKIEVVYRESNVNLPSLTQSVIDLSHFLKENGVFLLLSILFIIGSIIYSYRIEKIRYYIDRTILSIPIFGEIIRKKMLVIFCEFLSTLLDSGIIIHRALAIIKNGMGNKFYEQELNEIIEEVKLGKTLSGSMWGDFIEKKIRGEEAPEGTIYEKRLFCFPVELTTAVKIGEQTGMLSKMLEKAASRYNKEVDNTIKNLSSLLEPFIIVLIGSIVGVIIMAIMLPFFNMVNVIG